MKEKIEWLPPLVLFENYGGNWDQYLDALYKFFKEDFIDSAPNPEGMKVALKRHSIEKGKKPHSGTSYRKGNRKRIDCLI